MSLSSAQRRLLTLGLIPVIVLVLAGGAITVSTIRGKLDFDYTAEFRQPVNAVTIVSEVPVSVIPSTDDKVHVDISGSYTSRKPQTAVRQSEARELEIGVSCAGADCDIALSVALPSSTTLSVNTTRTSLDLVGLSGEVSLSAYNGSVNGVRLKSAKVTAEVHSGSLDLGFVYAPTTVDASTTSGSLHLLVPATETYAIDAVASGGSATLDVHSDPAAHNALNLRSTGGSITVDSAG
ncbi:MAG: hypothetical protein QOH84_1392 [Kribbellaceae bacterium]|nr:hypothetical protein [Kribbellaceae bacterium]